ncbi:replication protein A 32 kDa subunit A-like [Rhododendron vialii]|uniref:replication protein A 32 kDa subunit A-like n=1 Tax=Rhododendron vialii TaxID=182163 RepID=UPI00265F9C54|nr:replication protein A 32 kDa subunit A-like [Rhododendron vialii]
MPVTNFDELTFLFVECIHFQVQNSRTKQGDATTQSHSVTPSTNTISRDGSNGYQSTPPNHFSGRFSVEGLKGFDQMVLDYLQQPSNF